MIPINNRVGVGVQPTTCPETDVPRRYSAIRQRLHDKAHTYFIFEKLALPKRNQFFGATDALLDTNIDASQYSKSIIHAPEAKLLLCYGFLQTLYVQQDSVQVLSKAVGLKWRANNVPELSKIRDVRNRLSGHPAEAGVDRKPHAPSSAIINYTDIHPDYFDGVVYYEKRSERVTVDVAKFLFTNQKFLLLQMEVVEAEMDKQERSFRSEHVSEPFARHFGNGFAYLLQRLHCSLDDEGRRYQCESHAKMLKERFAGLQRALRSHSFNIEANNPAFRVIDHGLNRILKILSHEESSFKQQADLDLICAGIEKHVDDLMRDVRSLDDRLAQAVY